MVEGGVNCVQTFMIRHLRFRHHMSDVDLRVKDNTDAGHLWQRTGTGGYRLLSAHSFRAEFDNDLPIDDYFIVTFDSLITGQLYYSHFGDGGITLPIRKGE